MTRTPGKPPKADAARLATLPPALRCGAGRAPRRRHLRGGRAHAVWRAVVAVARRVARCPSPGRTAAGCLAGLLPLAALAQAPVPVVPPAASAPPAGAASAPGARLAPVEVIGTAPLPGLGVDRKVLPYATQSFRRDRIDATQSDNLVDFMNRNLVGVQVNDVQGSPFQGDLTFRGFRASPLLGAGQGVSVYLDGIRVNEAFGDVVNWDLLPEFALASVTLVPGANPAFGLNTLGGALALTTLSGLSAPGLRAELTGASFGRARADLAYGASFEGGWHAYGAASGFREDGWRAHSPGHLGNLFLKLGRSDAADDWDLSLLRGRSRLIGNGLVPAYTLEEAADGSVTRRPDLYAADRNVIYTYPDITINTLTQAGLNWRHRFDDDLELSALVYLRNSSRSTVSGDTADDDDAVATAQFNTTATSQKGQGAALALSGRSGAHQWQVGASVDASRSDFAQYAQAAELTPDRGTAALDAPAELGAAVHGRSLALGVYATDTWEIAPRTHLTGTARYNRSRVSNRLTSVDEESGEVREAPEERFTYGSLNPALGIAHRLDGGPTLVANIARNNRVPTVIELGCADPAEPCRLPAGLQSDPYLKQVISRSTELGLRWPFSKDSGVDLTWFRTDNRDDILFRSVSVTAQEGFFQNFPRTRYEGVDAEAHTRLGAVALQLSYSFLEATYQADGLLRLGDRNIEVGRGTRIAGLPRHTIKLAADWQALPGLSLGGDLQASSRRVTAGNEDGRIEDGSDRRVDVSLPGHATVNLRLAWRPDQRGGDGEPGWSFFAKVNNLFDRRYENYAALAGTVFDPQGRYTGEERAAVFVAPGAPRSLSAGVRLRY